MTSADPHKPQGLDPDTIRFTPNLLAHADRVGFTIEQMRRAIADPRWVNDVRNQPHDPHQTQPRRRYCGHGVAVILEGTTAIAVIADDERKQPRHR